ncbi:hypothetical protein D3230_09535 [Leucobacter chromiireducens subsp. solipictus]|uniref:Uncharacterized protein n=1 Tax=Leucobacter chromiireducens subsp. solipictus TaxID=398235 RepID=A0ABS1SG37_9MICO|nr:hypothetical protein [Leucobacter chromiireducens subsp. solipictus]
MRGGAVLEPLFRRAACANFGSPFTGGLRFPILLAVMFHLPEPQILAGALTGGREIGQECRLKFGVATTDDGPSALPHLVENV